MSAWKRAMTWLLLAGLMVGLFGALPAAQAEATFHTFIAASNSFPGSFTRNLYKGCTGSDVRVLQRLLKDLGYYTGAVDGIFGNNTRTAVQNFQRRNGLGVDGIAGRNTYRILLGGDAVGPGGSGGSGGSGHLPAGRSYLQFGDENEQVLAVQVQLKALGYYSGPLTGYYGSQTRTAVRNFQSRNMIGVDGLAGRITLSLMFSGNAIPASGYVVPTPTPTPGSSWRVLRYGMVGTDVAEAQTRLRNLGYYGGVIHGEFNTETRYAVEKFQERNWLTRDGIIGQATYVRLFSANAVPAASACPTPTPTPPWWVTPTPSPSPTPTPTSPAVCAQCGQYILNAADHALAECGVPGHYKCTNTAPALHLASTTCVGCGKYACQGGSHAQLECGHLACEPGNHAKANCGNHWLCRISDGDLPAHMDLMPCGKHYLCSVTKPDLHTVYPCPY